jgi:hypothetical protein
MFKQDPTLMLPPRRHVAHLVELPDGIKFEASGRIQVIQ